MSAGAFRLDHVAIAVSDLEQALSLYRDVLGLAVSEVEVVEEQEVSTVFVGEAPGRIELLCPTSDDSPVGRFIAKRGEGLHHIAVQVKNIELALESLKASGVQLIDHSPKQGAHNTRIAFVHPKGARGVLLELVELPAEE